MCEQCCQLRPKAPICGFRMSTWMSPPGEGEEDFLFALVRVRAGDLNRAGNQSLEHVSSSFKWHQTTEFVRFAKLADLFAPLGHRLPPLGALLVQRDGGQLEQHPGQRVRVSR